MQLPAKTVPLVEVVFPRANIGRDVLFIVAFSLMTAGFARISIPLPFTPVPITGQTLAVLLTGAALGSRRGALAMLAYLAEGSAGLPVFAGGGSGLFWNMASGGYLVGYVPAAYLVGFLTERGWNKGTWGPSSHAVGERGPLHPRVDSTGLLGGLGQDPIPGPISIYRRRPGEALHSFAGVALGLDHRQLAQEVGPWR